MVAVHRPKNDYCLPALDLSQEPRPIINFGTPLNNYQELERIRSLRFISWSMQCKMCRNCVRQLPNVASVLAINCSIEISIFSVLKSKISERHCLRPTIIYLGLRLGTFALLIIIMTTTMNIMFISFLDV